MTFALVIGCAVGFVILLAAAVYELVTAPVRPDFDRHVDEALANVDEPRPEFTDECKRLIEDELARRRDGRVQS